MGVAEIVTSTTSAGRAGLLVVFSLGLSLALLALLEGGARVAGLGGERMSRLPYQQVYLPSLLPATGPDGEALLRTGDVRMWRQQIRAEKPEAGLRVLVFGASASAGLGFSPNAAFARPLERILQEALPGRRVEVLNLSIVALPAKSVKQLLDDAAHRYDPDVLIVYSGNNEFMEIHAERYQELRGGFASRLRDRLMGLHLARFLVRLFEGPVQAPSLAQQDVSQADVRQAERTIIQEVEIGEDERGRIIDEYEGHLREMVASARSTETPIVLATVASNWRWRGLRDLADGWAREEAGTGSEEREAVLLRARAKLSARIPTASQEERAEALYRRAVVHEALGDLASARSDYKAAKDADPHLRRALGAGNERVRAVASEAGVPLADIEALLAADAASGVIGFESFYDNVHFTPEGALLVAAELFRVMQAEGLLPPTPKFSVLGWLAREAERRGELDALSAGDWMGFGFDRSRIALRDPWKYDRLKDELDTRIAADPTDWRALAYRGNIFVHRIGGAAAAREDYAAALKIEDNAEVRANSEGLRRAAE
jgi:tetratricopeptide (TPR) repeat protein